jgi:hypothetical protein
MGDLVVYVILAHQGWKQKLVGFAATGVHAVSTTSVLGHGIPLDPLMYAALISAICRGSLGALLCP